MIARIRTWLHSTGQTLYNSPRFNAILTTVVYGSLLAGIAAAGVFLLSRLIALVARMSGIVWSVIYSLACDWHF